MFTKVTAWVKTNLPKVEVFFKKAGRSAMKKLPKFIKAVAIMTAMSYLLVLTEGRAMDIFPEARDSFSALYEMAHAVVNFTGLIYHFGAMIVDTLTNVIEKIF